MKGPQAIAPVGTRCLHLQFPDKLLAGAQPWIQSSLLLLWLTGHVANETIAEPNCWPPGVIVALSLVLTL